MLQPYLAANIGLTPKTAPLIPWAVRFGLRGFESKDKNMTINNLFFYAA